MERKIKRGPKDRQVICDKCGAYYKGGCEYYVRNKTQKCIKQK